MAYISTQDIQATLDKQLKTIVDLPTFYSENFFAQQNGKSVFCRSTLAPAKSVIISMGTKKVVEQTGLYQVDLFHPVDFGYAPGRILADKVINAFLPGFLTLSSGDQLIIHTAWSQPAMNDQSAFLMIPVLVEWVIRNQV